MMPACYFGGEKMKKPIQPTETLKTIDTAGIGEIILINGQKHRVCMTDDYRRFSSLDPSLQEA